MNDLIERLRAVKWEEIDDGGWMTDDQTHLCVFVDMRPAEFEALLREAAAALEAARKDAERYRWLRDNGPDVVGGIVGEGFGVILRWPDVDIGAATLDAAIDQARGNGV